MVSICNLLIATKIKHHTFSILPFLLLAGALNCGVCHAGSSSLASHQYKNNYICLSLKTLTDLVKAGHFTDEARNMGGIGKVVGYVLDKKNRDVILIGVSSNTSPSINIDDFVVDMRNVWNGLPDPFCSLDPQPENILMLQKFLSEQSPFASERDSGQFMDELREKCGPQRVRIGGVPRDSRFAHVMINADYHMKKVQQGIISVPPVHSQLDIMLEDARDKIRKYGRLPEFKLSISRFWFHIKNGEPTFIKQDGMVMIKSCTMVVLTEKQRYDADGVLHDVAEDDDYAIAFAKEMSDYLGSGSLTVPEFLELNNLFRLHALVKAMHYENVFETSDIDLNFWLNEYEYREKSIMPNSLSCIANVKKVRYEKKMGNQTKIFFVYQMVAGGVGMEMHLDSRSFYPETSTKIPLKALVISKRPSPDTLTWNVDLSSFPAKSQEAIEKVNPSTQKTSTSKTQKVHQNKKEKKGIFPNIFEKLGLTK